MVCRPVICVLRNCPVWSVNQSSRYQGLVLYGQQTSDLYTKDLYCMASKPVIYVPRNCTVWPVNQSSTYQGLVLYGQQTSHLCTKDLYCMASRPIIYVPRNCTVWPVDQSSEADKRYYSMNKIHLIIQNNINHCLCLHLYQPLSRHCIHLNLCADTFTHRTQSTGISFHSNQYTDSDIQYGYSHHKGGMSTRQNTKMAWKISPKKPWLYIYYIYYIYIYIQ